MSEQTETVKGRKSKEDALHSISFLNDKNEESARVPTVVTGVKVSSASGKAKVVNLKEIPPQVLGQFVAYAVRSKLNGFVKDATDAEQVINLTDEFIKVCKDATIFIPKEGGGPGRSVDVDFWVAVLAKVAELKIKAKVPNVVPMSDEAKAAFAQKLLAMTTEQRKEAQKRWEQDKTFRNAVVLVRAERVEAKMEAEGVKESEYDVLADL